MFDLLSLGNYIPIYGFWMILEQYLQFWGIIDQVKKLKHKILHTIVEG